MRLCGSAAQSRNCSGCGSSHGTMNLQVLSHLISNLKKRGGGIGVMVGEVRIEEEGEERVPFTRV